MVCTCVCTCTDTLTLHRYKREFGFTIPERSVIVDDIRVRGTAKAFSHQPHKLPAASTTPKVASVSCCMNIHTDLMLQPTFDCACTCTVPRHSTYNGLMWIFNSKLSLIVRSLFGYSPQNASLRRGYWRLVYTYWKIWQTVTVFQDLPSS